MPLPHAGRVQELHRVSRFAKAGHFVLAEYHFRPTFGHSRKQRNAPTYFAGRNRSSHKLPETFESLCGSRASLVFLFRCAPRLFPRLEWDNGLKN